MKKYLVYLTAIFSFLGFLDATYLTIIHYQNKIPPCSLAHGCETVLTSKFSTIGPIPLAVIGLGFYALMLVLCLLVMVNKKHQLLNLFLPLATLAIIQSIVYFSIQALIIHAYCQYCMTSEIINIILFILSILIYKSLKRHSKVDIKA